MPFPLDASDFLRKHPWPGRSIADTFDDSTHRTGNISKRLMNAFKIVCGRTGAEEDMYDEAEAEDDRVLYDATENQDTTMPFYWSKELQKSFREELEKYVYQIKWIIRLLTELLRLVILGMRGDFRTTFVASMTDYFLQTILCSTLIAAQITI